MTSDRIRQVRLNLSLIQQGKASAVTEVVDGNLPVPQARSEDVVVTASDGELLVYDVPAHHIHHLNAMSAAVWRQCDGQRTIDQISEIASRELAQPIDRATVALAVRKLADAELLTAPVPDARLPLPASRRVFLRRGARLGVAAVPAIVSITAPLAHAAASSGCEMHTSGNLVQDCGRSGMTGLCCYDPRDTSTGVCNGGGECQRIPG